jgi:hypothetical protein
MKKREKHDHAIRILEDHLLNNYVGANDTPLSKRRRKQVRDAIVALGGDDPETETGGGPDGPDSPALP